jgi:hypothetical protein
MSQKDNSKKIVILFNLGIISFIFSVLSHWDAVYVLPIVIYLWFHIFRLIKNNKKIFSIGVVSVIFWIVLFTGLFAFPYINSLISNKENIQYFGTRVDLSFDPGDYKNRIIDYYRKIELYNPFIFLPFIASVVFLASMAYKRGLLIKVWFIVIFIFFILLIKKSGTHVYNLLIPVFFLSGVAHSALYDLFNKRISFLSNVLFSVICIFLFYQSYILFIDHKVEYPFETEKVWKYSTKEYNSKTLSNFKIGFTYRRGWFAVNKYLHDQQFQNQTPLYFISNDDNTIARFYVNLPYGTKGNYYMVGVKRPYSFEIDFRYPHISKKMKVNEIQVNNRGTMNVYKFTGITNNNAK